MQDRNICDHIVDGDISSNKLTITVLDEPGQGGASYDYRISATYQKGEKTPIQHHIDDAVIRIGSNGEITITLGRVKFQNGPIKEFGVNGVTHEALLAIVIDRLRSFQNGRYPSSENEQALTYCEAALASLKQRTRKRIQRGIEGTNQV